MTIYELLKSYMKIKLGVMGQNTLYLRKKLKQLTKIPKPDLSTSLKLKESL